MRQGMVSLCTWVEVQPRERVLRLAAVHAGLLHLLNLLLALRLRPLHTSGQRGEAV